MKDSGGHYKADVDAQIYRDPALVGHLGPPRPPFPSNHMQLVQLRSWLDHDPAPGTLTTSQHSATYIAGFAIDCQYSTVGAVQLLMPRLHRHALDILASSK